MARVRKCVLLWVSTSSPHIKSAMSPEKRSGILNHISICCVIKTLLYIVWFWFSAKSSVRFFFWCSNSGWHRRRRSRPGQRSSPPASTAGSRMWADHFPSPSSSPPWCHTWLWDSWGDLASCSPGGPDGRLGNLTWLRGGDKRRY